MFKKLKMCLAAFVAAALTITGAGCTIGKSTANAMTIDGYDLKAGVYIFYQNTALETAKQKAAEENSELDTTDEEALKATKIEGKDFLDWVKDETYKSCRQHVMVIKKFDELGLKLENSEIDSVNNYADSIYADETDSNIYFFNGISKDSLKEVMLNSYKSSSIFESMYGKDGSEGIKSEDVRKFYTDNTSRIKYVKLDLTDKEGNELDDAGKKEVKELADKLLKEVQGKKGDELLKAFDDIKSEYDEYVASKNSETSEGEEASSETTETTVAVAEEETTEATAAEEETTEAASEEETTETDSEEETAEETTASEDEETAETTAPEDENGDTTETTVSTAPEDETAETSETTTTPDPHENESLVSRITTDKDTKEEDLSYTPCKKIHDWAFDEKEKTEEPKIIEDDTAYYVTVKLDLEERMGSDDLWNDDREDSVRYNMYNDEFQDKLKEWAEKLELKENESAINRYKPFDYREPETTAAKKQTEPMY